MEQSILRFISNVYGLTENISIPPFWCLREHEPDPLTKRGSVKIVVMPIPERGGGIYESLVPVGEAMAALKLMHQADRSALEWLAQGEREYQKKKKVPVVGWLLASGVEVEYEKKAPELERACRHATREVLLLVDRYATGDHRTKSQQNLHHWRYVVGRWAEEPIRR